MSTRNWGIKNNKNILISQNNFNKEKYKRELSGQPTDTIVFELFLFFYVCFLLFFFFFLALRTYTSVDNISIYSYIHNEYVYIPVMHSLYILIFFTDMWNRREKMTVKNKKFKWNKMHKTNLLIETTCKCTLHNFCVFRNDFTFFIIFFFICFFLFVFLNYYLFTYVGEVTLI